MMDSSSLEQNSPMILDDTIKFSSGSDRSELPEQEDDDDDSEELKRRQIIQEREDLLVNCDEYKVSMLLLFFFFFFFCWLQSLCFGFKLRR
jgi:hypothetical protein